MSRCLAATVVAAGAEMWFHEMRTRGGRAIGHRRGWGGLQAAIAPAVSPAIVLAPAVAVAVAPALGTAAYLLPASLHRKKRAALWRHRHLR